LQPQSIDLNIIHEDSDMLVINKQAGIPVHPGPGHQDGTVANALIEIYPNVKNVGSVDRPGIVHRLDMDTSGLMVVAKTQEAHLNIARQFENRTVEKTYLALVTGNLEREEAVIEAAIGRSPGDRQRMSVLENGREAITRYKVIRRYENFDLLEIRLLTGRTHQIRVHMASLGHPVAGDKIYGREIDHLVRQFLHSAILQFSHPATGKTVQYEASLPGDIAQFLNFC
jgi:23S rRNA pseudouridine1911/1915/1917 synthase